MILDVLDHLVGDDYVEAALLEREIVAVADHELNVLGGVALACLADRRGTDVDAGHLSGGSAQDRRAVTGTARQIEHPAAADILAAEGIAVQVLVNDPPALLGRI